MWGEEERRGSQSQRGKQWRQEQRKTERSEESGLTYVFIRHHLIPLIGTVTPSSVEDSVTGESLQSDLRFFMNIQILSFVPLQVHGRTILAKLFSYFQSTECYKGILNSCNFNLFSEMCYFFIVECQNECFHWY